MRDDQVLPITGEVWCKAGVKLFPCEASAQTNTILRVLAGAHHDVHASRRSWRIREGIQLTSRSDLKFCHGTNLRLE